MSSLRKFHGFVSSFLVISSAVNVGAAFSAEGTANYEKCFVDHALAQNDLKAAFDANPRSSIRRVMSKGDTACSKLASQLLIESQIGAARLSEARKDAESVIRQKLIAMTPGNENLIEEEVKRRADERLKDEEILRQKALATEKQKQEEVEAASKPDATGPKRNDDMDDEDPEKAQLDQLNSILANDPADTKFKLEKDADWETFKPLVSDMGKHIAWKRVCDQKPYDAEMSISVILIVSVTRTPSELEIAQTIFARAASELPRCEKYVEGVVRFVNSRKAFLDVDRFRKTGAF